VAARCEAVRSERSLLLGRADGRLEEGQRRLPLPACVSFEKKENTDWDTNTPSYEARRPLPIDRGETRGRPAQSMPPLPCTGTTRRSTLGMLITLHGYCSRRAGAEAPWRAQPACLTTASTAHVLTTMTRPEGSDDASVVAVAGHGEVDYGGDLRLVADVAAGVGRRVRA
jgi:hypothetical protein